MNLNPIRAWRHHAAARHAQRHGIPALIACDRDDTHAYQRHMHAVARHGPAALYLTCILWFVAVKHTTPAGHYDGGDGGWTLQVGRRPDPDHPDDWDNFEQVDNPDAHPDAAAALWAARMFVAVLNNDNDMATALFQARANAGTHTLADGINHAATLACNMLRETPAGAHLLRR